MFFLLRHCTFDILPSTFLRSTLFRRFNEVRVSIFLYFDIFTFRYFLFSTFLLSMFLSFDIFTFDQSRVNQENCVVMKNTYILL
jgi:hypothetical protein